MSLLTANFSLLSYHNIYMTDPSCCHDRLTALTAPLAYADAELKHLKPIERTVGIKTSLQHSVLAFFSEAFE